jgi:aspartyl-tRNA synthetase
MEESTAPTSKKGAKKAEAKAKKEALKAQRAAELAATNLTLEDDPVADSYGDRRSTTSLFSHDAEEVEIRSLNKSHIDKTVIVRGWLQNSRVQSAKMGFLELRKNGNWSIQGIVMASDSEDGRPIVSRRMVKWVMGINPESFVAVEAKVKQPLEPIKSCRVQELELHITKCYLLASAPSMLGITLAVANQPIVNFSDDTVQADKQADKTIAPAASIVPAASMLTHLDNIAMHKRSAVQQAIAVRCPPAVHGLDAY